MAKITLKGMETNTLGEILSPGSKLPDFFLTDSKMIDVNLNDFSGKKLILNIFPSVDTGTCAASVRAFNKEAANLDNTEVLCISEDLPFAHARFCGAEGIDNVRSLSTYKKRQFSTDYKLRILDGALEGLLSRAVIVADSSGTVVYSEQVPEIVNEPNYAAALDAVKACS